MNDTFAEWPPSLPPAERRCSPWGLGAGGSPALPAAPAEPGARLAAEDAPADPGGGVPPAGPGDACSDFGT